MHESHDAAAEISALKREIQQWTQGIRCVFAVINLFPLYYCTRLLMMTPKVEVIFEDMLGAVDRVPPATQFVLRFWPAVLGGVWLLAVLSIFLIFVLKKASHVWITTAVFLFAMIATGHLAAALLLEPVLQIIANLSGGGE